MADFATFTVIAVSASRGPEDAEVYLVTSEFSVAAEAVGYARRMAEEAHQLAGQLDLDFDTSHVSVFEGEVEMDNADVDHPDFIGMWFFLEDGVDWASAETLREAETEGDGAGEEDAA
jgi:hypothetical protein